MTVLAFDTSAGACSAAVLGPGGAVLARRSELLARGHAERLMPMIREVLAEAGREVTALDLIAVTVGPGAFTGIRIGLAAARGLALASAVPLIGITSLAAAAEAVSEEERAGRPLLVAIDSRRGDFFVQLFAAAGDATSQPAAVSPDDLPRLLPPGDVIVAGDAAAAAASLLREAGRAAAVAERAGPPDTVAVARLALARFARGEPPSSVRPLYLRAPQVTLPSRQSDGRPPHG